MKRDQPSSPNGGPVELEIRGFLGTLGVIGALRRQKEPDFRVAQIVSEACEQQLLEVTSADGLIATIRQSVGLGSPQVSVDLKEAYAFVLFPVFLAGIRAGGAHAASLGSSLLVYAFLKYQPLAVSSADYQKHLEPEREPGLFEATLTGLFGFYARALDRDSGVASWTLGHAMVQSVTGISDVARRQAAAAHVARWFREQLQHWTARVHHGLMPVEAMGDPSRWLVLLPEYVHVSSAQIQELELVRSALGISPSEFALHLAGHPECSKMAQRQVYRRIQEAFPDGPSELHLALLLRSRVLAAKLSGGDLFGLASRAPFDSDEVTEPELILLFNALAEMHITSFDLLLAAIEKDENTLSQVPPSARASAAVVRVTAILRGEA